MPFLQSSNSPKNANAVTPTDARHVPVWQVILVWFLRLAVGGIFICSGFVKSIDLWGSVYKIEEYLQAWGMMQPRILVLAGAALLSWTEFVAGALTLLGCYRRAAVWVLTAFIAFMLPLTGYIWAVDPVSDCGCFGDWLVLSNAATFIKNVGITIALVPLLMWNRRVAGVFVPYTQWFVGAWVSAFIIVVGIVGFNVNPMLDFRRFPVGTDLYAAVNGLYDRSLEPVYEFIYAKDGKEQAFSEDNLPDEDDGWQFVDRRLVAGSEEFNDGITIFDAEDNDVSTEVITDQGPMLLVVVPDVHRVNPGQTFLMNELAGKMRDDNGSMIALLAKDDDGLEYWQDISMPDYNVYRVEGTVLKELVRGNPGVVMLKDGKVQWKMTLSWLGHYDAQVLAGIGVDYDHWLWTLTGIELLGLAIIWIIDRAGLGVSLLVLRPRRRREQEKK